MKIFNSLDEIIIDGKTAIALGNFDGIHIGHVEVLNGALHNAQDRSLKSLCFTFSNHPFNYIMGRDESDPAALKLICSESTKISILESMGFDYLVNVPFDERIMKMRANDFFEEIPVKLFNSAIISVGFNYTYGTRAEGKSEDLLRVGKEHGIDVHIHDAVMLGGKVVSSTLIREAVASGDMALAEAMLGRAYSFHGVVEHGKSVGNSNGFPTVNICPGINRLLPPFGVYAGSTEIAGLKYKSIVNIGTQPTFNGKEVRIESHLFGYSGDAYNKEVIVHLKKFIRSEKKFDSSDELYAQIKKDCEEL